MGELPTGTVTFLFTDVEGSTRLLRAQGEAYPGIVEAHAELIRASLRRHGGIEVSTEGDAFFAVFPSARDAIAGAADAQIALAQHPWPEGIRVAVRMGLHTGEGRLGGDDYVGIDVNCAARIASAAHGGQVLLSDATRAVAAGSLPNGVSIRDLGSHRLKDLDAPERLFQLDIEGLRSDFPPLRAPRPGNLPTPPTSFVGRATEAADVETLLGRGRLVTLIGPGGAGKTRLALRVAAQLATGYVDGAWFVALDTVAEPELVPTAIVHALELERGGEGDPMAVLRDHLRDRHLLLVLDNFEQVVAAGTTVDELLRSAEQLRVLITSRAALGLYGEQLYHVPPMATTDPASLPPLERLSQYESVALFIARAQAVKPDFEVTNENAPAVAEICARLDGLPLAIELAAARTRLLPPQAIVKRLGNRLDVLSSATANLPPRQRTLRGAIAWSHDLLPDAERHLLERSAAFSGGFELDALEAVADPGGELGVDIFEGLGHLVDGSLVHQVEADGEGRFALLETIREFGLERLEERAEAAL